MSQTADDPDALSRIAAFAQGLQELGWTVGGNMRMDTRWGGGDLDRFRRYAAEFQPAGTRRWNLVSAEEVRARWAYSELLSDRPYDDPSVQELKKKALERVPFEDLTAEEHSVLVDRI